MEKINIHLTVPAALYDKLKKEGLIDRDNKPEIGHVWISRTSLKDVRIAIGLPERTPYMHFASISDMHIDLKTTPM